MDHKTDSDEQLIAEFLAGDRQAYGRLVERLRKILSVNILGCHRRVSRSFWGSW